RRIWTDRGVFGPRVESSPSGFLAHEFSSVCSAKAAESARSFPQEGFSTDRGVVRGWRSEASTLVLWSSNGYAGADGRAGCMVGGNASSAVIFDAAGCRWPALSPQEKNLSRWPIAPGICGQDHPRERGAPVSRN